MDIYQKARENMVECQLKPDGVSNPEILEAYLTIPREIFVPAHRKDVAYIDEDIMFDDGRFLLEPSTHGRMVQALNLGKDEAVLNVGCATGYSAAILSSLAKTVISTSNSSEAIEAAKKNCEALGLYNVVFFYEENIQNGCPEYAPFRAMIFNGAIPFLPENILNNLATDGRIVYIERPSGSPIGRAILLQKLESGAFSKIALFDAATPYLPGYRPEEEFSF